MDNSTKKITPKELNKILENHKRWLKSNKEKGERANLSGANLREMDLGGVNLREANLERADLRRSTKNRRLLNGELNNLEAKVTNLNLEKDKLEDKLEASNLSEQEKEKLDSENQELKDEIVLLTKQIKNIKETQSQIHGVEGVIKEIIKSTNDNNILINQHKNHSYWLFHFGVSSIGFAVFVLIHFAFNKNIFFESFNPKLLLPLFFVSIGISLLRHDWKIRQILTDLLKQQQKVSYASSLLEASLELEKFAGKENKVEQTFDAITQALLGVSPKKTAFKDREDKNDSSIAQVTKLDKTIKLLADK